MSRDATPNTDPIRDEDPARDDDPTPAGDPRPAGDPASDGDPAPDAHPAPDGDPTPAGNPTSVGDPTPAGDQAPEGRSDPVGDEASDGEPVPDDRHASNDDPAPDGHAGRCAWADGPEVLRRHHDEEWGRPVHDERAWFELLTLVTFGSGLSWATVLRKRDAFRAAFGGFDPDRVAAFGPVDVARPLADAGIVRNRRKVDAALRNARATVALRADGGIDALVWSYADDARAERPSPGWRPTTRAEVPTGTATSRALGADLRSRGFALVGPTVAYALLQTAGIVDDHLEGCPVVPSRAPRTGAAV